MQLILPFTKKDRQSFVKCALEIGFDEFVAHKFIYTILDSDLDVLQLMYDDRISLLIYGWEVCDIYLQNARNGNVEGSYNPSKNLQVVIKWLSRYSLDIWLSTEWDNCDLKMRMGLLFCMRRIKDVLLQIPEIALLNWDYMLTSWDLRPWHQRYVNRFLKSNQRLQYSLEQSIEKIEAPASKEDVDYLREEDILIILLRLIKMLDSFFMEGAKQLSMRVIAAWNAVYERAKEIPNNETPDLPEEYKKCIISICHIYLLAVYEMDDNRGFVIDNMMSNIRFYHQIFLEKKFRNPLSAIAQLNFTPARFIALTCVNLNITINEFFEMFTSHSSEKNFSTLFGVISQSYISYILGNQLMEMNTANTDSFNANLESYKRIYNLYLEEREASEMFCKDQLHRQQLQRNSHTASRTMKNLTDFASKLCKGNRPNNIGNCENADEDNQEDQSLEAHTNNDKKTDPVFQNIPNNEKILKYVYEILANRSFDGWRFAKTILLPKIICHEVNQIENWRYHPGLTIDFMLNLDIKLSKYYEDLAAIFQDYYFLEQEFWLTAFYLNPIRKYYDAVMRCGGRFNRRQNQADEIIDPPKNERHDRGNEKHIIHAKYGLLSSTIDVKEIGKMTDHDKINADYDTLTEALDDLKLPESTIKNLLTVTFLSRNKNYAWAVNWQELRKRCKKLLKYPEYKRNLVELNMAEANDRLKYLKVDYEKYKHRPQLDYGSIEQGYENVMNAADRDDESDDDDDTDDEDDIDGGEKNKEEKEDQSDADAEDDNDDDEKNQEDADNSDSDGDQQGKKRRGRKRKKPDASIMTKKELELIADICSTGTRRTRARTAAALATVRETEKNKENEKNKEKEEEQEKEKVKEEQKEETIEEEEVDKPPDFGENVAVDETKLEIISDVPQLKNEKRNWNELLEECPLFSNKTTGFAAIADIWGFDSKVLQTVDVGCAILPETFKCLHQFPIWRKYVDGIKTEADEHTNSFNIKNEMLEQSDEITTGNITDIKTETDANSTSFDIKKEPLDQNGELTKGDITENILQETSGVDKENKEMGKDISESSNKESSQLTENKNSDRTEYEKGATATEIEKEGDSEAPEAKSGEQQISLIHAEENVFNNFVPEIVSDEFMTLVTDETIAVEEVIIEEKDNHEKNEITISKELPIECENVVVRIAERVESEDKDDVNTVGLATNFIDATADEPLSDEIFKDTKNENKGEDMQKNSQTNSNYDEQLQIAESLQLSVDKNYNENEIIDKVEKQLQNDNNIQDDKLKDDGQLKCDDQVKNNNKTKDDQLKNDDLHMSDGLKKNKDQLNDDQLKCDGQLNADKENVNQIKGYDQLKHDDQLNNDDQLKDDSQLKDDTKVDTNDMSSQDQAEQIANKCNEAQNSTDSIEKNTFVESDNSTECDFTIRENSKKIHDDEIQVGTKSELKGATDVSSNESEKLNAPSIDRIEAIETVLKAEENSNDKKIAVDSFLHADDENKSIDAENKISGYNLADFVIESTHEKRTAYSDDDNSTNMSEEIFWNIRIEDVAAKADKDENEELCRKFSLKDAVVRLKRLTVDDLSQLRQPCVKLCRLDSETVIPPKRSLRKVEHKSYIGLDDSSNSSSYSSKTLKPKVYMKRKISHSPGFISSDDDEALRPVKTARPQTARKRQLHNVPSDRPRGRPKKHVITPRSASGLKMRISSVTAKKTHDNFDSIDLINISSSSSSPLVYEPSGYEDEHLDPTDFVTTCVTTEPLETNDPLYEELILCD